jgi:hypothetical protein
MKIGKPVRRFRIDPIEVPIPAAKVKAESDTAPQQPVAEEASSDQ